MDDRVAELRARWTPEATAAAVAFLESRPVNFDLPTMEQGGVTYLDLRGLRIEQTQIDKAYLRNVNLRWAQFRDVGFKNARFVGCNLSQARFEACYLRRAKFEKCDLVNSHFDRCDFSQALVSEGRIDFASFRGCELGLENVKLRADATPAAVARVLRALKLNALSRGDLAGAGELAYRERAEERRALRARGAWGAWAASAAQNALWGYGERPWRLAAAIALAIVAFAFALDLAQALPGRSWWDHLYYSGLTFFTLGHGEAWPAGALARALTVLEGAAGLASFALLVAAIAKKILYR